MRVRLRARKKSRVLVWWQKWRKRVTVGAIGVGGAVALALGGWFILSLFSPLTAAECRERLGRGGFASDLKEGSGAVTGTVWAAPPSGGVVIFQEVSIIGSGGKCQSVTADVYSNGDGKKSTSRTQLGSFSYSLGSGLAVKETNPGAPSPLAARARAEFEQMITQLAQPVEK